MNDTVDRLARMLDEERQARYADKTNTKTVMAALHDQLSTARRHLATVERDRERAENKIDEWMAYATKLSALIQPKSHRRIPAAPSAYTRGL